MFRKIPDVLTAEKLIENSFRSINKVEVMDRAPLYRKKKTIIAKTESFSSGVISNLEQYVKKFPSIDDLPSFYRDLLEIKVNVDKLKKALGAVDWARKTCKNIYSKQSRSLIKSKNIDFLLKKQQEIFGRFSSVVRQIDNELKVLAEAQKILKNLPEIQDIPTVVIAGYPNVGKSSILRCLSAAKPEIAEYPFTTKEIYIGHIEIKEKYTSRYLQVIDTPGLLDRPFSDRNNIERQAIAALAHLADVIVFVIDPSESCGYLLKDQLHLLSEIKKMFSTSSYIIVENKIDLKKTDSTYLKISCETREGIDVLLKEIISLIKSKDFE